mmetsp:Transcript_17870/g.25808  ORF Transcript_17870/g.25808 Transcript_17870/m.25808 type:complete len:115 (+) Transcript_17870:629-973(+)
MRPPSSLPTGIKFMALMRSPEHPTMVRGCTARVEAFNTLAGSMNFDTAPMNIEELSSDVGICGYHSVISPYPVIIKPTMNAAIDIDSPTAGPAIATSKKSDLLFGKLLSGVMLP